MLLSTLSIDSCGDDAVFYDKLLVLIADYKNSKSDKSPQLSSNLFLDIF